MFDKFGQIDKKEMDLPETTFIRDIEIRVFQSIVLRCLSKIQGVVPVDSKLLDNLLGRDGPERLSSVSIEQDQKNHSVNIKIEIKVAYGVAIPEKAEEIQTKVSEEISAFTGLHVGLVHVIFKGLMPLDQECGLEIVDNKESSAELLIPKK